MSDEGSTFKVPYTTIKNITVHPAADRLEVAWVYGWQVVVQKGKYQVGDNVVYVPIDSILPQGLEDKLFPADSKIKLHRHRVRQIRIRGLASQGMIISPNDVDKEDIDWTLENNLAEDLGITKYEPPAIGPAQTIGGPKNRNKRTDNPHFLKFNGIDNIKWFPDLFTENDEVVIQEKIHGSHIRFGKAPYVATTLWKKILKFLRLAPEFENVYGSNNVEISNKLTYSGYYGDDIYGSLLKQYDVFSKIKPNEFVHGELYGDGVQKNYSYGTKEHKLVIFDVRVLQEDGTHKWLNPEEAEAFAKERGFEFVPVLYTGKFNKEQVYSLTKGNSILCSEQKVREGIVIKARTGYDVGQSKKCLKFISEEYLDDKSNTDFH